MNSREMLLSLIDRYILEEADRRKQYNDKQLEELVVTKSRKGTR